MVVVVGVGVYVDVYVEVYVAAVDGVGWAVGVCDVCECWSLTRALMPMAAALATTAITIAIRRGP